jgi:hypothetical protein
MVEGVLKNNYSHKDILQILRESWHRMEIEIVIRTSDQLGNQLQQ